MIKLQYTLQPLMYTSVIDWTFYWFPSLITHAECNKIVRIVYQPQTKGESLTNFSCVLPTSQVGYYTQ